ncbi:MAG: hypothetical protein HOP16_21760, partial [Acidobacteria bacterium]|nr:hypothetical protein [Acidobacteriota bacterium]
MSVPTIRFTAAELDDFARLSGDFNPLHTSDLYARRTPWGERVVFGVLGVIRALATLPTRAGEELASLQADFVGPMFVDTDYEVTVAWPKPTTAKIKVQDGTKVVTRVTARFRPASGTAIAARDDPRSALRADAIDRAAEDVVAGLRAAGAYATDGDRLRALQSRLDLAACGVPP